MKKTIYIISILLAGILLTVWSCSKEEVKTSNDSPTNLSPRDMQVNGLIRHFKNELAMYRENPQLKSGETVPADSALWYLEATINYSHAFPNAYYQQFKVDTSYLIVPVNADGTVDMVLLTQKYDVMKAQVAALYHNVAFTAKGLVLVDLTETSQTGSEIVMNVQTVTGEKGEEPPPPVNGPFTEIDNWWYGENGGYCEDPSVWDDAANQLKQATVGLIPDPNGTYYFINEFTFTVAGGDPDLRRPNDDENNYLDYYLYYSIEGSPEIPFDTYDMLCMEYQEMNNYYSFMNNLLFNVLPNQYLPNVFSKYGYSIISLNDVDDDKYSEDPYTYYYHEAEFTYGIKIGFDQGEGPTEL